MVTTIPTNLGSLIGTAASSLSVLQYAPYLIIIVVIGFVIWRLAIARKPAIATFGGAIKTTSKDAPRNRALLISLKHKASFGILPFSVMRIYDAEKNVEEARAIFPTPGQSTSKLSDLKNYFKALVTRQPIQLKAPQEIDKGVAFNEAICLRNELGGWDTIYTLEENLQLPMTLGISLNDDKTILEKIGKWIAEQKASNIPPEQKATLDSFYSDLLKTYETKVQQLPFVTDNEKVREEINDLIRATEKRVSRLKQAQQAMQNFIGTNTQPMQQSMLLGMGMMIILLVLVIIGYNYGSNLIGAINGLAHAHIITVISNSTPP
ncbi:MAG: hypothetical protein QXS81_01465 [Candidatus Micrarchaeaceae archaeon]